MLEKHRQYICRTRRPATLARPSKLGFSERPCFNKWSGELKKIFDNNLRLLHTGIRVHIRVHTCMHARAHTYVHIHTNMPTHTHMSTNIHKHLKKKGMEVAED